MSTVRYIALRPDNYEDGRGPMQRVREFQSKKAAISWVRQQTGILGGKQGDGWTIVKETVNEDGTYAPREDVWG